MKGIVFFIFILLCVLSIDAQEILDFESYKKRVLKFHPVIKQASNQVKIGENEVLKAKGQLDPIFESDISGKQFDGIEYYNLSNTGLKIPTWLGIDFKTGYEANRGAFVNAQNTTPSSGLWYAGIDVPLGQGLFFDERRATIKIAKIFQENSLNEQILIKNDLLLDAYAAYWFWYESYKKFSISKEGLDFSENRFKAVKENARLGDVPFIDTVEAKIQLDSRKMDFIQADFDFQNASLLLNLFLWSDDFVPLELDKKTIPDLTIKNDFQEGLLKERILDSVSTSVPLIMSFLYKLEQLQVEEHWKKEQLKPQVNLSYNPLSRPVGNNPFQNFSTSNYKFGVSVYVPLFLRKERGAFQQAKLKVENSKLDLKYKIYELKQKETQLKNDIIRLYTQVEIQNQQVKQAKTLRDSEQIRFEIGESSLFLVNSRELSYLSYKATLAELEAKLKISEAKWKWILSELE